MAMYKPTPPARPAAPRAASGRISANTPTGARATTQRTSCSIASHRASKNPTSRSREAGGVRVIASASRIVNTTSGSIAPVAAAAMGFCGTSDVSQLAKPFPASAAVIWPAAAAAPSGSGARTEPVAGRSAKRVIAAGMNRSAVTASCTTKMAIVRPPIRPIDARFLVDAIPVISRETTSGITVIRIAFTQSVPTGATRSAARRCARLPEAAIAAPASRASARATRTATLLFMLPILHHQVAAVDVQRGAGEVPGRFGGGEANEVRDLPGGAQPRDRKRGRDLREPLGRRALARELRVDHPRAHGVDGDAEGSQLLGGGAGESQEPGFGGRVVGAAQRADHATGGGRDIDDATVVLRLHRLQRGFDHQERRGHVDLQREPPFGGGDLGESRRRRAGSVVDDDVDAPELFHRAADDGVRDAICGEVARDGQRAAAERRCDRTGAGGVADVDGDGGTALVQADGGGAA